VSDERDRIEARLSGARAVLMDLASAYGRHSHIVGDPEAAALYHEELWAAAREFAAAETHVANTRDLTPEQLARGHVARETVCAQVDEILHYDVDDLIDQAGCGEQHLPDGSVLVTVRVRCPGEEIDRAMEPDVPPPPPPKAERGHPKRK
jgi:hypothetical protein